MLIALVLLLRLVVQSVCLAFRRSCSMVLMVLVLVLVAVAVVSCLG